MTDRPAFWPVVFSRISRAHSICKPVIQKSRAQPTSLEPDSELFWPSPLSLRYIPFVCGRRLRRSEVPVSMRSLFAVFSLSLFILSAAAADKPSDWLPVTQQEKDIKDVPGYSGSAAVQLYYDYYKDENDRFENVYHRIKILRPAGMAPGTGYADAEILLEPGISLQSLAARTIQPDGTIVEFTGKPFDKTVFKHQGVKFAVKTFSFPAVTVGSILEYRYVLNLPLHVVSPVSAWPIQGPLFTVKAHFRFRAFQGLVLVPSELDNSSHHSRVSYAYLNQVDATIP